MVSVSHSSRGIAELSLPSGRPQSGACTVSMGVVGCRSRRVIRDGWLQRHPARSRRNKGIGHDDAKGFRGSRPLSPHHRLRRDIRIERVGGRNRFTSAE